MLQKITVPFAQRIGIVIEHPGSGGAEDVGLKELKTTRIATLSNICIVTKVWESGTAWYARELARGLIELGVRVALVAPAFKPSELELDLTDDQQSLFLRRKTTREDNSNPNKIFRYWSKLLRILDGVIAVVRLRSRFKIYLFSMPDPIISPLLFLLLRLSGARVLLVVHDPFPHGLTITERSNWLLRLKLKILYLTPSALIILTEGGKKVVNQQFGVNLSKIFPIPHPGFGSIVEKPIEGTGRLLVFGSIRPDKNILEVILAVKQARLRWPTLRLHIAGNPGGGNEAYWATCLAAIQDDPAGFVIDARFIQESEIPGIIADSDAFVLAYQNFESQSGVAVLAGLSGRPVIATRMDGFLELQQQGLVMFQIPGKGTPADIVAAIEKLQIASLAQLREQTSNGRLRLQHSLSVKRVASLVLDAAKRP